MVAKDGMYTLHIHSYIITWYNIQYHICMHACYMSLGVTCVFADQAGEANDEHEGEPPKDESGADKEMDGDEVNNYQPDTIELPVSACSS